jgi:uncharacterized protein
MFGLRDRDAFFFQSFSDHAARSKQAAGELVRLFGNMGDRADCAQLVKQLEREADDITRATVKQLRETWITPFDRDDIHALINKLDDVIDAMHAVSQRTVVFNIEVVRPEAVSLSEILLASCTHMAAAVQLLAGLKSPEQLLAHCRSMDQLEGEADQVFRKALASLYQTGADPILVLKWRDVFDNLEGATDRINDVGNLLEGIVLEYA